MFNKQLRELEADDLIQRKVYPEALPKIEYSLTPKGQTLEPIIHVLKHWGKVYLNA